MSKLLGVSGGMHQREVFGILTHLSWVSKSFRRDIGQILTWKVFSIYNVCTMYVFMKNLIFENGGNWCGSVPETIEFLNLKTLAFD